MDDIEEFNEIINEEAKEIINEEVKEMVNRLMARGVNADRFLIEVKLQNAEPQEFDNIQNNQF